MEQSANELYNTAAELAKQFDKVIGKIRERDRTAATAAAKAASPTATTGAPDGAGDKYASAPGGRQQPQQQQQQPPPQPHSEKKQQKQQKPQVQQQLVKLLALLLQQKHKPELQKQMIELLASYVQEQPGQAAQQKNEDQPEVQQWKSKEQETHEQQQQQQQQQHHNRMIQFEPQLVTTNASNNLAASPQQTVRLEPNELRLVLKLVPSISENGSLIVRPSTQEDRADSWNASPAANPSFPTTHQQCNNGDQDEDEDYEDVCVQIDSGAVDCRLARIAPNQQRSKTLQQQQQQQPVLHSHSNASQKRVRQADAGGKQQLSANHVSSGVKRISSAFPKQQSTEFSASRRRRDYPQSGGDGCQMNNHHDNVMAGSRGSDCGSFCDDSVNGSSDSDCVSIEGLRPAQAVEDCDMRQLMEMLQVPDSISRSCTAGRY